MKKQTGCTVKNQRKKEELPNVNQKQADQINKHAG